MRPAGFYSGLKESFEGCVGSKKLGDQITSQMEARRNSFTGRPDSKFKRDLSPAEKEKLTEKDTVEIHKLFGKLGLDFATDVPDNLKSQLINKEAKVILQKMADEIAA